MREILFRGKAANREDYRVYRTIYKNGDWVYGLLTNRENYLGFAEMTNEGGVQCIEVDKDTIGQFTGVCDKNGTKIFEGDIISIMFETDGVDGFSGYSWFETAEVIYSEEKHAWIVVFNDGGEEMYLSEYDDVDDVVVIANIYDEPKSTSN